MPELNLRKIFPTVYFVNKNLSEERVQVLLIETELNQLPDNSQIESTNQITTAIWKNQVQLSAIENMVF